MQQPQLVQSKKLLAGIIVTPTIGFAGKYCARTYYIGIFFIGRSAVEILLYLHFLEVSNEVGSNMLQSMAREHVKDGKRKGHDVTTC